MAPITPPTSSFLNLNLASIRLRREIKSAKTWKKYSITFSPFLTCQSVQRRMVQELELELELEQSWQLPLTAAAIGGRALWKPSFSSENWIFVRVCLAVWCLEVIAIQKVLHNSLQISCLNWHVILIFETKFLSFWTWYWDIVLRSDKIGGDKQPVNTDPVVLKYSLCGACWASGWIFELKFWRRLSGKSVQDKWPESTGHSLVVGLLPGCRPALWPVGAKICAPPATIPPAPPARSGFGLPSSKSTSTPIYAFVMPLWCHGMAEFIHPSYLPTRVLILVDFSISETQAPEMVPCGLCFLNSNSNAYPCGVRSQICETPTRGTCRKVPSQSGISEERFFSFGTVNST